MGKRKPADGMAVNTASKYLSIPAKKLRNQISAGKINCTDGRISRSVLDELQRQKEQYISLREYLSWQDGDRFNSSLTRNRAKYIDYLERNDYFGVPVVESDQLLLTVSGKNEFFIPRADLAFLDYKSRPFFEDFGLSEHEKADRILAGKKTGRFVRENIQRYISSIKDEENIYTPSLTEFLQIVCEMPDIRTATDEDLFGAIESAGTRKARELLVNFFNYTAAHEDVAYHVVELKKAEESSVAAYPYADFIRLAKVLFNEAYDTDHGLTAKAVETAIYAETWLFLACHYVCGWRASDICQRWVYPNLKDDANPFGINTETLKKDILSGSIPDSTYDSIALYVIRRIEMAFNVPGKTGRGKLRSAIMPALRPFFGKLELIAEYHHLASGDGYMKTCRISRYKNWVTCREFFGDGIFSITGMHALSSRRLNKSYLQGMEQAARADGNTTLVSHVIASYARSHANVDTTVAYLKDHGLTGESAEVVLCMMMQRGVFGVSLYHALLAAFPDAFGKLTVKEQSRLMAQVPLSAYELESAGSVFAASEEMAAELACGKTGLPQVVLRAMLAIGQGQGKAKDEGVYCKRKALGLCCDHPLYESCLANLCPHYVFTSEGVPALVRVIRDYAEKARHTGDKKYEAALRKCIIPAFQDVLNDVIREMSGAEKASTRKLLEEVLHE